MSKPLLAIVLILFLLWPATALSPTQSQFFPSEELFLSARYFPLFVKEKRLYAHSGASESVSVRDFVKSYYPSLYWIVFCESSFREKVCSYRGCEYGMGLVQVIPSTLNYCEKKLGRKLNPFEKKDNLDCGLWLLENEGNSHWNASRHCWIKRL